MESKAAGLSLCPARCSHLSMEHSCWFLLGSWKFIPTVWRESKIWNSLCQQPCDQSQSALWIPFLFKSKNISLMDAQYALGSRLEINLGPFSQQSITLVLSLWLKVSLFDTDKKQDGINRGFLLARKQMLVLEMKYCHGKDSWGHPCWLRTEQREKDWGTQKEPNSSPKLGKKLLMASQAHGRKPQWIPNILPQTAGLGSSSCRLHGPQQKVRNFMGNGPKLPNVLVPGGEILPWATSTENAECWIQSQQLLLLPRSPNPPC